MFGFTVPFSLPPLDKGRCPADAGRRGKGEGKGGEVLK